LVSLHPRGAGNLCVWGFPGCAKLENSSQIIENPWNLPAIGVIGMLRRTTGDAPAPCPG
jgi:hypothetical protein